MRVLVDTHVLIWAVVVPHRLSDLASRSFADPGTTLVVSAVSGYEIAQKNRLGKLSMDAVINDFQGHLARLSAEELPLTGAHAILAARLVSAHRDPFDRMLVAQSMLEGLPILSADPQFVSLGVQPIW